MARDVQCEAGSCRALNNYVSIQWKMVEARKSLEEGSMVQPAEGPGRMYVFLLFLLLLLLLLLLLMSTTFIASAAPSGTSSSP